MSVATLKRKSASKYNNVSVGQRNFSINGTHRSQGWVGQNLISRSLPRTLMVNDTPRGHGGCCGSYPKTAIVQSAVWSTEDPSVIKSSCLMTDGLIATKYRWVLRPQPYSTTKPDSNLNNATAGQYTENLTSSTVYSVGICTRTANPAPPVRTNAPNKLFTSATNYQQIGRTRKDACLMTTKVVGPLTAGEYVLQMEGQCADNPPTVNSGNNAALPSHA